VSETFSAQIWLGQVLRLLQAEGGPPRGQDPDLVYNMKGKKLNVKEVEDALKLAKDIAGQGLQKI